MVCRAMKTATIVFLLMLASSTVQADWTRFRGPNGSGTSSDGEPTPSSWSDSENLRWKVAIPGPGSSSPIVVGDRVFVTCWSGNQSNRVGTPIILDGRLYACSNKVVNCYDVATGSEIFKSRLRSPGASSADQPDESVAPRGPGGPGGGRGGGGFGGRGGGMGGQDYASPVAADDKLYFTMRSGDIFVLKAGGQFEQLAVNRLAEAGADFSATPAISHGQLFIRSSKHLYCVASQTER